ncbi:hypothetical protein MIR68_004514 [Amoeboaphelidium protococcarum]|nr:hypothetical protein MIR68_004514 [Amoeboaphelidium protococcarum]
MEEDQDDIVSVQEEPSSELWAVEYPGHVINISKAERMLGGMQELYQRVQHGHQVDLRLRLSSISAHPIAGQTVTTNNQYLIKLSADQGDGYELLGSIGKMVRFREMPDFQYHSVDAGDDFHKLMLAVGDGDTDVIDKVLTGDKDLDFASKYHKNGSLLPIPVQFSRVKVPYDYKYKQHGNISSTSIDTADHNGLYSERYAEDSGEQRQNVSASHSYKFVQYQYDDNTSVPQNPPAAYGINNNDPSSSHHVDEQLMSTVQSLFDKTRPLWLFYQLHGEVKKTLPNVSAETLKNAVGQIAYRFKNGPWRFCWAQFGYDPRLDSTARYLQLIELRVRNIDMHFADEFRTYVNNLPVSLPEHLLDQIPYQPRQLCGRLMQMVDVRIPQFLQLLSQSGNCLRETADVHTGFFTQRMLTILRRFTLSIVSTAESQSTYSLIDDEMLDALLEKSLASLAQSSTRSHKHHDDDDNDDGDQSREVHQQQSSSHSIVDADTQQLTFLDNSQASSGQTNLLSLQQPKSITELLMTTTGQRRENFLNQQVDALMKQLDPNFVNNSNTDDDDADVYDYELGHQLNNEDFEGSDYDLLGDDENSDFPSYNEDEYGIVDIDGPEEQDDNLED